MGRCCSPAQNSPCVLKVAPQPLADTEEATFDVPYEPGNVTVAEAVLAEMADILTMNIRLEPSPLMEVPWEPPPPEPEARQEAEEEKHEEEEAPKPSTSTASLLPPAAEGKSKGKKDRPTSATSQPPPTEVEVEEAAPAAEEKGNEETLPGFRWWCETGIVANIDQVLVFDVSGVSCTQSDD
ncbi:CPK1 [Symbiodinium natans]|uniref:CPK1 protein n=1 Tax=Symbiodinium natans TaxID=878477 RepID=A0A812NT14_9DINO|nr:CPK1 [Symbiodinium natans]